LIEERLGNIERSLQELVRNTSQPQSLAAPQQRESYYTPSPQNSTQSQSTAQNSGKPKLPLYTTNPTLEQHDSSSGFEGSSSLAAHGAYASAFLESAVSKSSPQVLSSPKINAALSSLKQIVSIQNQRREADMQGDQASTKRARLGVRCDIRDLEMPPLPLVLRMLRQIKGMAYFGSNDLFILLISLV
jgi:hypothetical protein